MQNTGRPRSKGEKVPDLTDLSYSRPSYLAGSTASLTTGSNSSLTDGEEVSFAGQVNDRLGKLLGYVGVGAGRVDVEGALASIIGYEIVTKQKDKFTVFLNFTIKYFHVLSHSNFDLVRKFSKIQGVLAF